jgi:hypothetical protein
MSTTTTQSAVINRLETTAALNGQRLRELALEKMVRERTFGILADALGAHSQRGFGFEIVSITVSADYDPGYHKMADYGYAVVRRTGGTKTVVVMVHTPWLADLDYVTTSTWSRVMTLTGTRAGEMRGRRLARRLGIS